MMLEMLVDESLDMIEDESFDMIVDESLMVEDKSLEKHVDEILKLDEEHFESVIADCKDLSNTSSQESALWNVIENGNSFKPVAQTTTNVDGTSTTLIPGPVTTKEKVQKKNDVKARNLVVMKPQRRSEELFKSNVMRTLVLQA
ncbi:hypothetical protein Tco_0922241 [Tanacetum coccineum]|uniref:Uncharacterized protein n=1 Tax=Tanacetum coccineum TaxID=301880 RepID=A0ABQ5CZ80_9ASTR